MGSDGNGGRSRWLWITPIVAVIVLAAIAIVVLRPSSPPGATSDGTGLDTRWGFTHTQYSADQGAGGRAAQRAIAGQPMIQNQHIMGFGALNPEPAPGQYDWDTLDRRMRLIEETGGIPVITLCCAPDWMKGGSSGKTDWTRLEVAPEASHYKDFAELAARVAERYPQVRHFMVWNELKGFFDESKKRWNYEGYTNMYNQVYEALKAINPEIKVGGPYPDMRDDLGNPSELTGDWGNVDQRVLDAIKYWDENKAGADFVVVDGSVVTERGLIPDEFGALKKLSAVNAWLRRETGLPIWWAEWYVEPDDSGWPEDLRRAMYAAAMIEFVEGGTSVALYWSPQARRSACPPGCLWTNSSGRPTQYLDLLQNFARWFPVGTKTERVKVSSPTVRALAQAKKMIVVNTQEERTRVTVDGQTVTLGAGEVRWLDR